MKFILGALISIFCFSSYALQKIEEVHEGGLYLEGHDSLFLSDGEIVHINSDNKKLLELAKSAHTNSFYVEFEKNESSEDTADIISHITLLPELVLEPLTQPSLETPIVFSPENLKLLDFDLRDPLERANLTTLSSYDQAQRLMDTFNGETHNDSQCYNRAHMWTYESLATQKVSLGKVWIFFTRKYIREYRYKWWFHVSPYASVADGNQKYVLDRGFTQIPYNMTNWKNMFIKSQANCPVVTDYRTYENNQEAHHCYLIYSNQYYWQPYQLKNLATHGSIQWQYNTNDLRITYKDALIRWNGRIPRMDTTTQPERPPRPTPERPAPRPTPEDGDRRWLRIGERVISSNGVEGRVTRFLGNGYVDVLYDTARRPMSQHANGLAVMYGSSGGFHVGDRVLSVNGVRGYVSGIYRDGRVAVKYETSRTHYWQYPRDLRRW